MSLYIYEHISKQMKNALSVTLNDCNLGKFRLLAKLHKEKFSWRPIINCQKTPTEKICKLLDFLINSWPNLP